LPRLMWLTNALTAHAADSSTRLYNTHSEMHPKDRSSLTAQDRSTQADYSRLTFGTALDLLFPENATLSPGAQVVSQTGECKRNNVD
jgi:hypothetical protein